MGEGDIMASIGGERGAGAGGVVPGVVIAGVGEVLPAGQKVGEGSNGAVGGDAAAKARADQEVGDGDVVDDGGGPTDHGQFESGRQLAAQTDIHSSSSADVGRGGVGAGKGCAAIDIDAGMGGLGGRGGLGGEDGGGKQEGAEGEGAEGHA